jgi:hypothetical protein
MNELTDQMGKITGNEMDEGDSMCNVLVLRIRGGGTESKSTSNETREQWKERVAQHDAREAAKGTSAEDTQAAQEASERDRVARAAYQEQAAMCNGGDTIMEDTESNAADGNSKNSGNQSKNNGNQGSNSGGGQGGDTNTGSEWTVATGKRRTSYSKQEIAKAKSKSSVKWTTEGVQRENQRVEELNRARLEKAATESDSTVETSNTTRQARVTTVANTDYEVELLRAWGPDQMGNGNQPTTLNGLEPPSMYTTEPSKASINQNDGSTANTTNGTMDGNSTATTGNKATAQGNNNMHPERATNLQDSNRTEHTVRFEFFDRRNEAPRETLDELKWMFE